MFRISNVLLVSAVALGLSACQTEAPKTVAVPDCVFPSNPGQPAPNWVCSESAEGVEVSAGGAEKIVGGDANFAKDMAIASARAKMAGQMKTHVMGMIKKYMEVSGVGDSAAIDKVNTSVTKQITNEKLVGSKLIMSTTSADGTVYVLVGINEAAVQKITADAVKTSMGNDKALWQQFKAKQGQDEMAAEIAKQKVESEQAK